MPRPSQNIDQALLASGRALYPLHGCTGLSVRQICEHAGANLGMFHYHFRSKDNFLSTLLQTLYDEVFEQLQQKIALAQSLGAQNVMADVGIGFGKTVEHNWTLLKNLDYFQNLGVPTVLGLSRKSFLGKLLAIEKSSERDVPTLIVHALLPIMAANIIRVHNVGQMAMLKKIREKLA